jgi:hypothetical protein
MLALLLFGACSKKTTATATTTTAVPAVTPRPAATSEVNPEEMSMKDQRVEPDLDLAGDSAKSRKIAAREKAGPTEVFSLRKTPCYGSCPVFRLTIMSDGMVRYTGINNVDLIGDYRAKISSDRVDRMLRETIAAGLYRWSDTYPENMDFFIADASNTITKVVWNGREKTITNNSEAPEKLLELEQKLTALIAELKWEAQR